jgi:bifunctional non-homologous end joining protein LigD
VGYWDGKALRFASGVGSGFDDRALKQVLARLQPLHRETNPFSETPEVNGPVTWVRPDLVAEVNFQEWTNDAHLRAPVFAACATTSIPRPCTAPKPPAPFAHAAPRASAATTARATESRQGQGRRRRPRSTRSSSSSRQEEQPRTQHRRAPASAQHLDASTGPPTRRCSNRR